MHRYAVYQRIALIYKDLLFISRKKRAKMIGDHEPVFAFPSHAPVASQRQAS